MMTITILVIVLGWIGVSVFLGRKRKANLNAFSVAAEQMVTKANAIQQHTARQFGVLFAKLETQMPNVRIREGQRHHSLEAKLIKIFETVVYTKRKVVTYYDPERDIIVTSYESPKFLLAGSEIGPEEIQMAVKLKMQPSLDDDVVTSKPYEKIRRF